MKRLLIALALAGLAVGSASAQSLEVLEGAAELELSDITFPASTAGSVIFTECDTCGARTLQVDTSTVFVGSAGPVPLAEFLAEVAQLRATAEGQDTFVGLFFSLTTNRVTRIALHPDA
jgi:hypothetical protein